MRTVALYAVAALAALLAAVAHADSDQADERIDPTLEIIAAQSVDYSAYPFVKPSLNHIELNGADWTHLRRRFESARSGDSIFSIVYLGDSHIQADFGGAVFRQRIADVGGSAGRGLIIPFRMAGTNQPNDYTITGTGSTVTSRLLKQPWPTDMPFTGIGVQPTGGHITLHITAQEPFHSVRLLYRGADPQIAAFYGTDVADAIVFERVDPAQVVAEEARTDAHLRLHVPSGTVLAGAVLSNADAGTFVHSIGNNGATYSTYNQVNGFGGELAALNPDLVIVALGTNEAFGALDEATMRADVDILVSDIRRHNPRAAIMLVTPTECYRKRYKWRRGRRRAVGQTLNTKAVRARNVVASYARQNGIPLYDTYAIVGGDGSAARMKAARVLGADGVHFTSQGYRLQGSLLADAVLEQLMERPD